MALDIAIDKSIYRHDSTELPQITLTDQGSLARLKIGDIRYPDAAASPMDLEIPNESHKALTLAIRKQTIPAFTLGTNIAQSTGTFTRSAGSGYNGAYYNTALSLVKASIEAQIFGEGAAGISLQNGNVAINHDYTNANVRHSIVADVEQSNGKRLLVIREAGAVVPNRVKAYYELNDRLLLELDDLFVKYYLVKPDDTLILLRATRSKLSAAPKVHLMLYDTTSELRDVRVFNNEEDTATIETVGVLENFQDWQNEFVHASTADAIPMADNQAVYTYASQKRIIRNLSAALNMRTKTERDDFLDFFYAHGQEKEFIFVDNAHRDRDGEATEWWARFGSPFGDRARGSCLSIHQAAIVESMRRDIVVREGVPGVVDTEAPSVPANLTPTAASDSQIDVTWNASTDNVAVTGYRLQRATNSAFTTGLQTFNLGNVTNYSDTGLSPLTEYFYRIAARDAAGNFSAYSATASETTDAAYSPLTAHSWFGYHDADELAYANGADVVQYDDDSGNANHFVQSGGNALPVMETSTPELNNRKSVVLDTTAKAMIAPWGTGTNPCTVWIVGYVPVGTWGGILLCHGSGGIDITRVLTSPTGIHHYHPGFTEKTAFPTSSGKAVIRVEFRAAETRMFVNGVDVTDDATGTIKPGPNAELGNNGAWLPGSAGFKANFIGCSDGLVTGAAADAVDEFFAARIDLAL